MPVKAIEAAIREALIASKAADDWEIVLGIQAELDELYEEREAAHA